MARIAIVTNYRFCNYGSALQSYGLQTAIRRLGHSCENLKYDRPVKRVGFFNRIASVCQAPSRIFRRKLYAEPEERLLLFREFLDVYIEENPHLFESTEELKSSNNMYDTFVCGSDQIWAPNLFHEWYYLSFVDGNGRKVAYAPSIGLPAIPEHLQSRMAHLVSSIQFLSIREKQGAEVIKQITGIDVPVVLDPTLLLNYTEWSSIAVEPEIRGDYILCYFLGENAEHRRRINEYARRTGFKTVVLPFVPNDHQWGDINIVSAGPRQFLGLVKNARIICTDSFHGTLFSVNYNKTFYTFMRFKKGDRLNQNSRIESILEIFGLQQRLVSENSLSIEELPEIDYNPINQVLKTQRTRSLDYLASSLNESVSTSLRK